jgi:hypothetical protein
MHIPIVSYAPAVSTAALRLGNGYAGYPVISRMLP